MKTPEEIKKWLECCTHVTCNGCPYDEDGCATSQQIIDALEYIQQLERERDEARNDLDTINYANTELYSGYEAMKRERDAAVEQLKDVDTVDLFHCSHCKHEELCDDNLNSCDDCEKDCPCHTCVDMCNWQWRGAEVE